MMAKKTGNTPQYASELFLRISEDKRRRILETAVDVFASRGFAASNVNQIAEAAGISVGALYKYFASKDDLFMYLVEVAGARITEYVEAVLAEDIRLISKLERLLRLAQDYSKSDPSFIKLYNVLSSESDSERAALIARRLEGITSKAYREVIAAGQQSGEIRADIDAGILAFLLDNQLMIMQFSYACRYYGERLALFVGEDNVRDNEYLIRKIIAALESMCEIR